MYLTGTKVTDAGSASVGKITTLEKLRLSNNAISDVGLNHLGRLSKLRALDASSTDVGRQG